MMTRRDLAALRLAYECVRVFDPADPWAHAKAAIEALWVGGTFAQNLGRAAYDAVGPATTERLVRARLALGLRVLLRTAAGDYGERPVCPVCGYLPHLDRDGSETDSIGDGCLECWRARRYNAGVYVRMHVRPLWEQARKHRA